MASIEKRQTSKGTRYRVRITLKGHPRISETFKTRRLAQLWAERTTEQIRQGRYQPGSEAEQRTITDLFERYVADKVPTLAAPKENRRKLQWWCQELGWQSKLSQVTPEAIARARDKLAREPGQYGKILSPSTVRRHFIVLSSAFGMATKDWHWLKHNPCTRVRRPIEPRGRVRFLDRGERSRLLAACQASAHRPLYPLVVMALCTGARRAELVNLKWQDVDLERGLATLHDTKNGDRRVLMITGLAAEMMEEWSKVRHPDLVFPSACGKAVFPLRPWKKALEEAAVEDFRFHDLRHTFASYLAMSGATLAELAEALGHKSLTMVGRYTHLTEGHVSSVVARMTERFLVS